MSQSKRLRIPSAQQLQRWGNLIENIKQMEALEGNELADAPSEAQWDNFLNLLDELESVVTNLTEDVNTEGIKEDVSKLSISSNNKRKF